MSDNMFTPPENLRKVVLCKDCEYYDKNLRRINVRVTAQTAGNLEKLARMCGYGEVGRVIDKLVREKMISMRDWSQDEPKQRFIRPAAGRWPR